MRSVHAVLAVPTHATEGDLHHEQYRVVELPVAEDHQELRALPLDRGGHEAAVAGDLKHRGQARR